MCQYLSTGSAKSDFVAWGEGTNKNQRVNMRKASSMLACRQGGCRMSWACRIDQPWASGRNLLFPRSWDISRLNAQLPLPIPSSAASGCEQAVSRELLLPLTRDPVLAAVPWLRFSRH
jgi:hypothetical protein